MKRRRTGFLKVLMSSGFTGSRLVEEHVASASKSIRPLSFQFLLLLFVRLPQLIGASARGPISAKGEGPACRMHAWVFIGSYHRC